MKLIELVGELTAERVSSEVYYKNITSVTRSFSKNYVMARTDTSEPVEVKHSTYYAYLKFLVEIPWRAQKKRKFILDEEILEAENQKKKNEKIGCTMIVAVAFVIML